MKLNTITDEKEAYHFALQEKIKTEEVWREFEYYYSIKNGKNKGLDEIIQEYQQELIEWNDSQNQNLEITETEQDQRK